MPFSTDTIKCRDILLERVQERFDEIYRQKEAVRQQPPESWVAALKILRQRRKIFENIVAGVKVFDAQMQVFDELTTPHREMDEYAEAFIVRMDNLMHKFVDVSHFQINFTASTAAIPHKP